MNEHAANPFPVVGVGASAGGLEPLGQLLDGLSSQPGLAVVVVQHLDPHHESQLTSILQTHTPLRVVDAMHGQKRPPGCRELLLASVAAERFGRPVEPED